MRSNSVIKVFLTVILFVPELSLGGSVPYDPYTHNARKDYNNERDNRTGLTRNEFYLGQAQTQQGARPNVTIPAVSQPSPVIGQDTISNILDEARKVTARGYGPQATELDRQKAMNKLRYIEADLYDAVDAAFNAGTITDSERRSLLQSNKWPEAFVDGRPVPETDAQRLRRINRKYCGETVDGLLNP